MKLIRSLAVISLGLVIAGCSTIQKALPDKEIEYKREAEAERNLALPPDLTAGSGLGGESLGGSTASGSATYSAFSEAERLRTGRGSSTGDVLPQITNVKMMRDGDERWLLVSGDPQIVWDRVIRFWQDQGILLREQDPTAGLMRTSWLENRADIERDIVTDTVRGFFEGIYSAATRDQYRVRLERGPQPGTTEVYLTHYGMEEKIVTNNSGESEQHVWEHRGRDVALERGMLQRLMVSLGVSENQARSQVAQAARRGLVPTKMIDNRDGQALLLDTGFSRGWRLVGLALDRVGFAVEDRNRAEGVYFVRYADPGKDDEGGGGWLSGLAFWDSGPKISESETYQIKLQAVQGGVQVTVNNKAGEPERGGTGKRILNLIHEQLR